MASASTSDGGVGGGVGDWVEADGNQLQTALRLAVEGENYARAGAIRDELMARRTAGVFLSATFLLHLPFDHASTGSFRKPWRLRQNPRLLSVISIP